MRCFPDGFSLGITAPGSRCLLACIPILNTAADGGRIPSGIEV
ncbi:hypothetical protein [Actinomadura latina]|nr:hypothetical protein [Actinomadura latina]